MDVGRDSSRRLGSPFSYSNGPALETTENWRGRPRRQAKSLFVYDLDLLVEHFFELLTADAAVDATSGH